MSTPWFYMHDAPLQAGMCRLEAAESRHAAGSRRLRAGDAAIVFDGRGGIGQASVVALGPPVELQIVDIRQHPPPQPRLTLAVAAPRGPRQDLLVEKCTELGVSALWPVACQRSVALPSAGRLTKWRRTAVEACKQSRRPWVPDVADLQSLEGVMERAADFDHCWIADVAGDPPPTAIRGSVLAVIGPEGGLTDEELRRAAELGFPLVALGGGVLRIETAAIAVAARLHIA